MSSTATETYQQSVQNLQAWIDFLSSENERVQNQLSKMQGGGQSLPEVDADLPFIAEDDPGAPVLDDDEDNEVGKW